MPATIVGDRVVHGWNPKALAELVGVRYAEHKQLAPAELARRMDAVLAATGITPSATALYLVFTDQDNHYGHLVIYRVPTDPSVRAIPSGAPSPA